MTGREDPAPDGFVVVGPGEDVPGTVDLGHAPSAARVRAELDAGRVVLVRCGRSDAADTTIAEAVADLAVYAWLGVRAFATPHSAQARQALDMVASVRGERPPAVARRGLA